MEQNQTIEEQSKNLGKLEKNKVKTEKKLTTITSELKNQELRARDEIQQAQRLLDTQSSAIADLTHTEKQVQSVMQEIHYRQEFFMFLKEVSYDHQGCIYLIKNYSKCSNTVKYY